MNLKQLNEILKDLNSLQHNNLKKIIKLNKSMQTSEYDSDNGGQRIQIFDIVGEEDVKLKVVSYTGSYGEGEYVNEIQFVKAEEVCVIKLDPHYEYNDEDDE